MGLVLGVGVGVGLGLGFGFDEQGEPGGRFALVERLTKLDDFEHAADRAEGGDAQRGVITR